MYNFTHIAKLRLQIKSNLTHKKKCAIISLQAICTTDYLFCQVRLLDLIVAGKKI